uniref:Uncharacterized protein n=1 Tax=Cryptomonas curvata TaxID=233186 RepID=A0A7S0MMR9_9CRYP
MGAEKLAEMVLEHCSKLQIASPQMKTRARDPPPARQVSSRQAVPTLSTLPSPHLKYSPRPGICMRLTQLECEMLSIDTSMQSNFMPAVRRCFPLQYPRRLHYVRLR